MEAMDTGKNVCWVTAPTCRYGSAVYQAQMRFALGGSILEIDAEERIAGGACTECVLDIEYPLQRVDLFLTSVWLSPGALSGMTPDELAEAFQHPVRDIHEAVLLALGR
jgi:hypothetical protein